MRVRVERRDSILRGGSGGGRRRGGGQRAVLRRRSGAPETNRTSDLPLRRGLLYPLSYRGDAMRRRQGTKGLAAALGSIRRGMCRFYRNACLCLHLALPSQAAFMSPALRSHLSAVDRLALLLVCADWLGYRCHADHVVRAEARAPVGARGHGLRTRTARVLPRLRGDCTVHLAAALHRLHGNRPDRALASRRWPAHAFRDAGLRRAADT